MREKADAIMNGEICAVCGAYLEPGEKVCLQEDEAKLMTMPKNGKPAGIPVICANCK
jgi:predicted nucleic acid-binding Zn ribbon protein